MRVDRVVAHSATFALPADRLLNERLCVMVLAPGDTWVTYAIRAHTDVRGPRVALAGVAMIVFLLLLLALRAVNLTQWIFEDAARAPSSRALR